MANLKSAATPEDALDNAMALAEEQERKTSQIEDTLSRLDSCDEQELRQFARDHCILEDHTPVTFQNMRFMFTGTLAEFKRKVAQAAVEELGGIVLPKPASMKSADYLGLGDAAPGGSKLRCAIEQRINGAPNPVLISEQDFLSALAEK